MFETHFLVYQLIKFSKTHTLIILFFYFSNLQRALALDQLETCTVEGKCTVYTFLKNFLLSYF